jgi:hypothetical protein
LPVSLEQSKTHNPEKLAILDTEDDENNQKHTIQRNWQYWIQKMMKTIKNTQSRETGNIGYRT